MKKNFAALLLILAGGILAGYNFSSFSQPSTAILSPKMLVIGGLVLIAVGFYLYLKN